MIAVEDEALVLHDRRRPPRVLRPLADGEFFVADDPLRRVAFERDATGEVVALELRFADGNRSRFRRETGAGF